MKTFVQNSNKFMKKYLKIALLSISLLTVSSCIFPMALKKIDSNSLVNRFPDNQKAIIITKISDKDLDRRFSYFEKSTNWQEISSGNNSYFQEILNHNPNYRAYVVKPGIYSASRYNMSYNTYFNFEDPLWNDKDNLPTFASFEAKAGEVVYIGDINIGFVSKNTIDKGAGANLGFFAQAHQSNQYYLFVSVEDNLEGAKKYFEDNYPNMKNKITKRLIKTKFDKLKK